MTRDPRWSAHLKDLDHWNRVARNWGYIGAQYWSDEILRRSGWRVVHGEHGTCYLRPDAIGYMDGI